MSRKKGTKLLLKIKQKWIYVASPLTLSRAMSNKKGHSIFVLPRIFN